MKTVTLYGIARKRRGGSISWTLLPTTQPIADLSALEHAVAIYRESYGTIQEYALATITIETED